MLRDYDGRASPILRGNRDDPGTVHFDGDRALEESHRQHETVRTLEVHQDSLEPAKRSTFQSYSPANLKEWPGIVGQAGMNRRLKGGNFGFVNGNRTSARPDNPSNAGCRKDR